MTLYDEKLINAISDKKQKLHVLRQEKEKLVASEKFQNCYFAKNYIYDECIGKGLFEEYVCLKNNKCELQKHMVNKMNEINELKIEIKKLEQQAELIENC